MYTTKRVCAELGVCYKTLRSYRMKGLIQPVNPTATRRFKYTGQSILDCWSKICLL
ncbi:hypothetical protein EVA_13809 [gut metagenome]|uniref:HTH merR-type domain-containing protein n=1 Tax=gut metagenome TaxID=749906 RepID=J9CDR5_9ZZZZ